MMKIVLKPDISQSQRHVRLPQAIALVLICIIFSLAAGNRWIGWGKDYSQYLAAYNTTSPSFITGNSRFEIGYEIVSWIFAVKLNVQYSTLYICLCLISIGIKFYLFFKYMNNPVLAAVVYILFFYPIHEYTQIRAAIAIAFGFAAIHCLVERRWFFASFLTLLSIGFHSSAAVLVALGVLVVFVPRRISIIAILTGALLLFVILSVFTSNALIDLVSRINPLTFSYLDNLTDAENINLFSVSNIIGVISLFLMFSFKEYNSDKYIYKFMLLSLFGFVFLVLFDRSPVVALRLSEVVMLSIIFAGFRLPLNRHSIYIQGLLLANGAWLTFRAFSEGTLG